MADAESLTVVCERDGDEFLCHVTVGDDPDATHHEVGVTRADLRRYSRGSIDPVVLVTASFRFLLEHERRESILRTFDLPVIERYFPSYRTDVMGFIA